MTGWAANRFWTRVTVRKIPGGYEIALDDRPVRTPSKLPLGLPARALADRVAAEWEAQRDRIDPQSMPMTRRANSAIEKVRPQREAVIDHLLQYGATDLLCYRAEGPAELVDRQAAVWDPWVRWAERTLEARLAVTAGVIPVEQPSEALSGLRERIARLDDFELTAFHDLVTIPGSLVLGFAAERSAAPLDDIWDAARVDEAWQISQWGEDTEAAAADQRKRADFGDAAAFLAAVRAG